MRIKSVLVILVWLTVTALLAPGIDAYNHASAAGEEAYGAPFYLRMLGEGRSIVSALSILQADLYFHGGVGHFHDEHEETLAIGEREDEHAPEEHLPGDRRPEISPFNILLRISEEVAVTEHVHLHGDQMKEIVPWLYYAAEIDPHNVLAYTLTGFYLCDRLGKVEEGIAYLRKGISDNPDSWEINAELGRVYFQHREDYEAAVRLLSRARSLLREAPHDRFQERYVLSFLAMSHEALGRTEDALRLYRRLDELFPDSGIYQEKIKKLMIDRR